MQFGSYSILSTILVWLSPSPPKAPTIEIKPLPIHSSTISSITHPSPAQTVGTHTTKQCKPLTPSFPPFIDPLTATIRDLNAYLSNFTISSESLTLEYVRRIQHYDRSMPLNSIIETTPLEILLPIARNLDELRRNGTALSPLHGIPILVKDNIGTGPDLGLNTTAGSLALLPQNAGYVLHDADVIEKLRKMGAIILGKTNMSEFSSSRGDNTTFTDGYSARGGQTYSVHVYRGNPSGSSSGSAVGVSAGLSPISLGTDTDGSITGPVSRAGLYGIKPSVGLVSRKGVVMWSRTQDSVGVIGKSPWDVAAVLDGIVLNVDDEADDELEGEAVEYLRSTMRESYTSFSEQGTRERFKGIGIGVLNPEFWSSPMFTDGRAADALSALQKLEKAGAYVDHTNCSAPSLAHIIETNNGNMSLVLQHERKRELEAYLATLVWDTTDTNEKPLRTLQDIVAFNAHHANSELSPKLCCQEGFISSLNLTTSSSPFTLSTPSNFTSPPPPWNFSLPDSEKYSAALRWNRYYGHTLGLDYIFNAHPEIDVLAIPADGAASILPSLSGYPIATVPLGVEVDGTPFGLSFIGRRWSEGALIRVMSAWEEVVKEEKGVGWAVPAMC